jgi:hypothetical protein
VIVRELPDGRLLCANQTSHAHMAAEFIRHWGGDGKGDFAPLPLFDLTLLATAQHDNGWHEWEAAPLLRADGFPMDFLHWGNALGKLDLWRRGIARAWAQHPCASVLVGQHARLLYVEFPNDRLPPDVQAATDAFNAEQDAAVDVARTLFAGDAEMTRWLAPASVEAHARLLQFGDFASLQVAMPWAQRRVLRRCPLDDRGGFTEIAMEHTWGHGAGEITFDPWPYSVDAFTVAIHGRVLTQRTFATEAEYNAALATAPMLRLTWRVSRPA